MNRRNLLITSVGLIGVGCGERESNEQGKATPLIDSFVSRQSSSEIEERLKKSGTPVVVLEDGGAGRGRPGVRDPLAVRVLTADGFRHLDVSGELRLEFVDDELAATWFYPSDVQRFDAEMMRKGLSVQPGVSLRVPGGAELSVSVDFRGRKYWAWEDVILRAKFEKWIKRNT